MKWTSDQLAKIPDVYRDAMMTLRPVVESQNPSAIMKVSGIPVRTIHNVLSSRHGFDSDQVGTVIRTLVKAGWISQDHLGFITPTGPGEELIAALWGEADQSDARVPPLPVFEE